MAPPGFRGRTVVVTGAASGIGRATARRLLAEGASVALVDADERSLAAAVDEFGTDGTFASLTDVSSEKEVERMFSEVRDRFGHIDGLHNNAGIDSRPTLLAEMTSEEFDRLLRVNVRGVFLCLREMLRVLAEQGSAGAIVNTSSSLALRGAPRLGGYAATKAAVVSLTRTAALEAGGAGVRVNAVLPGPITTPMTAEVFARHREAILARVPQGRFGTPEEVATLIVWLLSDEASFVNGALFSADGGEAAGF